MLPHWKGGVASLAAIKGPLPFGADGKIRTCVCSSQGGPRCLVQSATSAHTERWIWSILVSVVLYCPPNLYTHFSTYARGSKCPSPHFSFRPPYRRKAASIVQHGTFHCCSRRIGWHPFIFYVPAVGIRFVYISRMNGQVMLSLRCDSRSRFTRMLKENALFLQWRGKMGLNHRLPVQSRMLCRLAIPLYGGASPASRLLSHFLTHSRHAIKGAPYEVSLKRQKSCLSSLRLYGWHCCQLSTHGPYTARIGGI